MKSSGSGRSSSDYNYFIARLLFFPLQYETSDHIMCFTGKLSISVDVFKDMYAVTVAIFSKHLSKKKKKRLHLLILLRLLLINVDRSFLFLSPKTNANFHTHTHKDNSIPRTSQTLNE